MFRFTFRARLSPAGGGLATPWGPKTSRNSLPGYLQLRRDLLDLELAEVTVCGGEQWPPRIARRPSHLDCYFCQLCAGFLAASSLGIIELLRIHQDAQRCSSMIIGRCSRGLSGDYVLQALMIPAQPPTRRMVSGGKLW